MASSCIAPQWRNQSDIRAGSANLNLTKRLACRVERDFQTQICICNCKYVLVAQDELLELILQNVPESRRFSWIWFTCWTVEVEQESLPLFLICELSPCSLSHGNIATPPIEWLVTMCMLICYAVRSIYQMTMQIHTLECIFLNRTGETWNLISR